MAHLVPPRAYIASVSSVDNIALKILWAVAPTYKTSTRKYTHSNCAKNANPKLYGNATNFQFLFELTFARIGLAIAICNARRPQSWVRNMCTQTQTETRYAHQHHHHHWDGGRETDCCIPVACCWRVCWPFHLRAASALFFCLQTAQQVACSCCFFLFPWNAQSPIPPVREHKIIIIAKNRACISMRLI